MSDEEKMQIDEYEKMWANDSKIDETNLIRESSRIPELHAKYYKLYHRAVMKTVKLKHEMKELERAKTEYYTGTMAEEDLKKHGWKPNPLKIMKSEVSRYIDTDSDVIRLSLQIEYYASIAKFLEDCVRHINTRNFIIKNMVELMRFQSGGY